MNIAIIGSGPSAFYTIQSLLREDIKVQIDIFEKHPAPFGLVRYGVAPDHQKTKNIMKKKLISCFLSNLPFKVKIAFATLLNTENSLYSNIIPFLSRRWFNAK